MQIGERIHHVPKLNHIIPKENIVRQVFPSGHVAHKGLLPRIEFNASFSSTLDRAKHNILPLSKFGLMQITRQRVRPELKLNTNEVCPTCNGSGNISPSINIMHQIEHDLRHITKVLKIKHLTIKAHPFIAGYISKGVFSLLQKWKFLYSFSIRTHAMSSYNFLEYTYHTKDGKKIIL